MAEAKKPRLVSVDFMRGLAVGWMIVANNPGDYMHVFRELTHAHWNGWTATDFVFPIFLFLVGVCTPLSIHRDKVLSGELEHFWRKAVKRAAILFLLGVFENGFPHFQLHTLRIPGVLQRIAIVYLAVVWLHVKFGNRGILAVIAGILIGYWVLMEYVPVPGVGHRSFTSEVNLEGWLDQKMLHSHIWEYDTTWDPEGILSTFPAIAIGAIGVLCGRWLKLGTGPSISRVFFYGFLMHMGGLALNRLFPINKSMCTSTFVLFVCGAGVMLLALTHWLMDIKGKTRGTAPFVALGVNSLSIYVASEIISVILFNIQVPTGPGTKTCLHFYLFDCFFAFWKHHYLASTAWSISFLLMLFIPAWVMYRKHFVIKI